MYLPNENFGRKKTKSKSLSVEDIVKAVGESLKTQSSDMSTSTKTFDTNIASDLSSWTGEAKDAFNESLKAIVSTTNETSAFAEKVGTHIVDAVAKIQDVETELEGSIKIEY